MRRKLRSPLPPRFGLDAARLRLPAEGSWATVRDHLVDRLPRVDPARIDQMLVRGEIVGVDGAVRPDTPFRPELVIWFHRDLPTEVHVPFEIDVVHRDERILVVHKPHFLASIPRGRHIQQTALVRLRRELDLPELSPAHRLDRMTAGLLMFVVPRELRGRYQTMFRDRLVHKEYEAIAGFDPALELPCVVRSNIVKERGVIAAQELPGPPNSETRVRLAEHRDGLGRYHLEPITGRTHQLRLHMASLGLPILGDGIYPELVEDDPADFSRPLQLLASTLAFTDPMTGEELVFRSPGALRAWTDHAGWATDRVAS